MFGFGKRNSLPYIDSYCVYFFSSALPKIFIELWPRIYSPCIVLGLSGYNNRLDYKAKYLRDHKRGSTIRGERESGTERSIYALYLKADILLNESLESFDCLSCPIRFTLCVEVWKALRDSLDPGERSESVGSGFGLPSYSCGTTIVTGAGLKIEWVPVDHELFY